MKILITGGAGFIGSHIVDACLQRGDEVFVIDNLSTGQRENISHHTGNSSLHFFEADICDTVRMEEIFGAVRPDAVFHLAAQVNVRHSIQDPHNCAQINILGTLSILAAMREAGCTRMIFASTGGVMFSTDTPPYSESDIPSPNTPYGISKFSAEQFIDFYSRQYGIRSTVLRYANVYGPRQDPRGEAGIICIFLDKIRENSAPIIFGDGEQTRDFIHVDDVVRANLHVLEKDILGVYHVGTGVETSVNTLWRNISTTKNTNLVPTYGPAIAEPRHVCLNIQKLLSTGWLPQYDIDQGIQSLLHVS
jgi:UDP-glucose 4-epimerase